MNDNFKRISPADLKAMFHDGGEFALLDAREHGVFNDRSILLAACVPLSRLEAPSRRPCPTSQRPRRLVR